MTTQPAVAARDLVAFLCEVAAFASRIRTDP